MTIGREPSPVMDKEFVGRCLGEGFDSGDARGELHEVIIGTHSRG
jgi:hypothetical protein